MPLRQVRVLNCATLSNTRSRLRRFLSSSAAFLTASFHRAGLRLPRERFGRRLLPSFFLEHAQGCPRTLDRGLTTLAAFLGIADRLPPRARAGLRGIRRR